MSKQALIDGDLAIFQVAAAVEYGRNPEDVDMNEAMASVENKLNKITRDSGCNDRRIFLSLGGNFRNFIAGDYKANRKDSWRPECLGPLREFAEAFLGAEGVPYLEADDLMAMYQTDNTVICTLDKDLLQVDGAHYRWPHSGKDEVHTTVTEGWRALYKQCLTGDSTDGIIGCGKRVAAIYKSGAKVGQEYTQRKGVGEKAAIKLLAPCDNEVWARNEVLGEYRKIFGDSHIIKFHQQMNLVRMIREMEGNEICLYNDTWMNAQTGEYRMEG